MITNGKRGAVMPWLQIHTTHCRGHLPGVPVDLLAALSLGCIRIFIYLTHIDNNNTIKCRCHGLSLPLNRVCK